MDGHLFTLFRIKDKFTPNQTRIVLILILIKPLYDIEKNSYMTHISKSVIDNLLFTLWIEGSD